MNPLLTSREVCRRLLAMTRGQSTRSHGVCHACDRTASVNVFGDLSICQRCNVLTHTTEPINHDFINDFHRLYDAARAADIIAIAAQALAGACMIVRNNEYAWCAWCQCNAEHRVIVGEKCAPMCHWCEIRVRGEQRDIIRRVSLASMLPLVDVAPLIARTLVHVYTL